MSEQPPLRKSFLLSRYRFILIVVAVGAIIAGIATGVLLKSLFPAKESRHGCTAEALLCPDGSAVGRSGPNCEFSPCSTTKTKPLPTKSLSYECPATEYVDCMPGPDARYRPQCEQDFLQWATKNCPNFKGAAL